eukprot:CAMPEP_0179465504 /NCGR_PEP_ID=MMETSP0799-20121207/47053_1 /TAXON_ID=46947 /ORGANISM="Geminigera cryophila, Strain CCMP2564" /LENGTH=163 /DNA_ID=CAMNT_0021269819 /DNA_START=281 /DNA_END=768 /DNA_ORIENTATION=-
MSDERSCTPTITSSTSSIRLSRWVSEEVHNKLKIVRNSVAAMNVLSARKLRLWTPQAPTNLKRSPKENEKTGNSTGGGDMRDILEVGVMSLTASAKIRILMTRFTMRTAKKAIFKYDVVPVRGVGSAQTIKEPVIAPDCAEAPASSSSARPPTGEITPNEWLP